MMARLARVMPKTAGTVGREPSTLLPWSSLSVGTAMGGSSEYTQVMLDVSRSLRPFLTAPARGQTEVFLSGATRILCVSRCSAAPMEENVGMPVSDALLSRDTLHLTVSMASTRMS